MAIEQLLVRLRLESGQYKTEAKQAAQATDKIATSAKTAGTAAGGLGNKVGGAATAFKLFGGVAAGAFAAARVTQWADESIQAFSDLEQSVGGTQAVFGESADAIEAFASKSADALGLSEAEFRTATTAIGGQLKRMTGDVDFAAEHAIELTQVAADLAATYGGTTAEAVQALGSAFRGEADPAERFNLDLKIGKVNAKAVELGLADTTGAVDDYARAQATLALISEQSADAQGQFAREADTAAGSAQRTAAAMENMKARAGEALVPFKQFIAQLQLLGAQNLGLLTLFFGDLTGSIDETTASIQKFEIQTGLSADSAAAAITIIESYGGSFKKLIPELALTEHELNLLRTASDETLASFGLNEAQIDDLREATAIYSNGEGRKVAGRMRDIRRETDDASDAIEDQAGAFDENERAIDRTVRQLGNYEDALRRLTDPVFKAIDDQNNLRDAQAAYTDAVEEFGPNSVPAIEAGFDLAEAQLAVNESSQNLPDDMQAATDSIILLGDQAGLSEYQLRLMDTALNNLDGRRIDIELAINRTGAPINPNTILGAEIGARQHGGPVMARTPYIVGERGPELFVPYTSGTVIPNVLQGTGGGSGGTTTHIHIGTVYGWDDFVRKVNQANVDGRRLGIAN